jgi:hypothetical protein
LLQIGIVTSQRRQRPRLKARRHSNGSVEVAPLLPQAEPPA